MFCSSVAKKETPQRGTESAEGTLLLGQPHQYSLCFAVWDLLKIVEMRGQLQQPFSLDIRAGADEILGGQHKLVVHNPLRFVVQTAAGVQRDYLIVLDREVVP